MTWRKGHGYQGSHVSPKIRVNLTVLAVASLIAATIAGGVVAYTSFPKAGTNSTNAASAYSTIMTTQRPMFVSLEATSSNNSIGLILTMSMNATQLANGQAIEISMNLNNSLPTVNSVSSRSSWPLQSLADAGSFNGGCPPVYDSFLFYRGDYVPANISSATPLYIGDPGFNLPCPAEWQDSYQFLPNSNDYLNCLTQSGSCGPDTIDEGWSGGAFTGFYNYTTGHFCTQPGQECGPDYAKVCAVGQVCNQSLFIAFPDGVYTIVAGDEWGQLAVLHFEVLPPAEQ
jgi:hypothetical protein